MSDKVTVKVGDMVSWGRQWQPAKGDKPGYWLTPAHIGIVKSFENSNRVRVPIAASATNATVEVERIHKKTGRILDTKTYHPYVSQLTVATQ